LANNKLRTTHVNKRLGPLVLLPGRKATHGDSRDIRSPVFRSKVANNGYEGSTKTSPPQRGSGEAMLRQTRRPLPHCQLS